MRWIYRHPSLYNFMDSVFSLSLADRMRARVFRSLECSSLVEVGIGSGKNMGLLVSPVRVGVDTSVDMLEHTRSKFHDVRLIVGDAVSLPLKSGSFDVSVFCYALRGFKRPLDAIREGLRVSSRVVIVDYDRPYFVPRFVWERIVNRLGHALYGSRDLDFAAIEELGATREVLRYYGGLYRVIILTA